MTLPLPYRTGSYLIHDYPAGAKSNLRKGTDLPDRGFRASGSHQLDEAPLITTLKSFLPRQGTLHLVDLRQETHAFFDSKFDSKAVSLYADRDWANVGRSASWIAEDELRLIDEVKKTANVKIFNLGKEDDEGCVLPDSFKDVKVLEAKTEEMVARSIPRVAYHRLPTTDHCAPFEMLEPFLKFFRQIDPDKDWVHFHCHGGDGRTTTFLALYDMAYWYKNWKTDRFPTLEQFAKRQCHLFKYSLNPDYDCQGQKTKPDWKYELARERWFLLGFMHWYFRNGLLYSADPLVLPDDWKSRALDV